MTDFIIYRECGRISHPVDDVIGVQTSNDTCRITDRSHSEESLIFLTL